MISTNQLKNGNHIEVDGVIFKVMEFQHVKPGKGGAFVRTKLRRASDGNVIDKTFRAGEKFRAVRTEGRKMTFLYADGTDAHFMDAESFEQLAIPEPTVADELRWTKPNDEVDMLFIDGAAVGVSSCRRPSSSRSRRPSPGCAATPPRAAATSRRRSRPARTIHGAAVRQRRRPRQGPDGDRRLHVARLGARLRRRRAAHADVAPHRPAARRRLRALPERGHGPRARRRARARRLDVHARARARRAGPPAGARRDHRAPRARLDDRPHRAAGARDHARRADRDAASRRRARPTRRSRPRARSTRPSRPRRASAAREAPGFVNGILAAALREMQRQCRSRDERPRHHDPRSPRARAWSSAAQQLRSGDLSTDAAAGLVEDCAALAGEASAELERLARASAAEPLPGQDTLL